MTLGVPVSIGDNAAVDVFSPWTKRLRGLSLEALPVVIVDEEPFWHDKKIVHRVLPQKVTSTVQM